MAFGGVPIISINENADDIARVTPSIMGSVPVIFASSRSVGPMVAIAGPSLISCVISVIKVAELNTSGYPDPIPYAVIVWRALDASHLDAPVSMSAFPNPITPKYSRTTPQCIFDKSSHSTSPKKTYSSVPKSAIVPMP